GFPGRRADAYRAGMTTLNSTVMAPLRNRMRPFAGCSDRRVALAILNGPSGRVRRMDMPGIERQATAKWNGDLMSGSGTFSGASGALSDLPVTWVARTEAPGGKTSPEELIASAHSTCYAMAFSNTLS